MPVGIFKPQKNKRKLKVELVESDITPGDKLKIQSSQAQVREETGETERDEEEELKAPGKKVRRSWAELKRIARKMKFSR